MVRTELLRILKDPVTYPDWGWKEMIAAVAETILTGPHVLLARLEPTHTPLPSEYLPLPAMIGP